MRSVNMTKTSLFIISWHAQCFPDQFSDGLWDILSIKSFYDVSIFLFVQHQIDSLAFGVEIIFVICFICLFCHLSASFLCFYQSIVQNFQFIEIHWCKMLSDVQNIKSLIWGRDWLLSNWTQLPFAKNTKSKDHIKSRHLSRSLMSHHILEIIESFLPSLIQSQALWQKPASPSSALLFMVSHSESLTWQMNVVWCSNIAPNGFYALSSISLLFYLSHELSIASSSDRDQSLWFIFNYVSWCIDQ